MKLNQYVIQTERLGLRAWRDTDIETMAAINADPRVMEFFPSVQSLDQTVSFVQRMMRKFDERGFCYFAVDRLDTSVMIGFIGLLDQDFKSPITPCVDIGWRLSPSAWRQGFATEGARACLIHAHEVLGLDSVFAIAPKVNQASIAVMQRIDMRWSCDFDHPALSDCPRLEKCTAYRSTNTRQPVETRVGFVSKK